MNFKVKGLHKKVILIRGMDGKKGGGKRVQSVGISKRLLISDLIVCEGELCYEQNESEEKRKELS